MRQSNTWAAVAVRSSASIFTTILERRSSFALGPRRVSFTMRSRGMPSPRVPQGTLIIEAGSRPSISGNTFHGVTPESVIIPPGMGRASLLRDNWFVNAPAERPAAPAPRPARGRR